MTSAEDWILIHQLTASYNRAVDGGDAEAFADLFTEDGALVVTRTGEAGTRRIEGRDQLMELASSRAPGELVHISADAIVEADGETAVQLCTLVLFKRPTREGTVSVSTGRYRDELVRTARGWRFVERAVVIDTANEGFFLQLAVNRDEKSAG